MGNSTQNVTLGQIANIVMGQSPTGDTYNKVGIGTPLLNGPTEFGESHPTPVSWTSTPTKKCKPGDVLFCVRGSTTGRMIASGVVLRLYVQSLVRVIRDLSFTR